MPTTRLAMKAIAASLLQDGVEDRGPGPERGQRGAGDGRQQHTHPARHAAQQGHGRNPLDLALLPGERIIIDRRSAPGGTAAAAGSGSGAELLLERRTQAPDR